MSLCRFLPTPSDRMGILWSLLCIKDAVILEYGPAGTTHFSMGLYGKLGVEQQNRLFTTHMNEDDVVMGDVSRLEKAILEVDNCTDAKVIFVVASSISAVIGTDIKGVCAYMQDQINATLICFDQGGLKGDYSVGLTETYKLLVKELVKKDVGKKDMTYNIIGLSMGQYRAKSDLWELQELIKEAFAYTLHTALCSETSVDKIQEMGSVEINIVLNHEALPAAKLLEKRYKTPYIFGSPYGYEGTLNWLKQISNVLGISINPKLEKRLTEKSHDIKQYQRFMTMMKKEKPTASILGDYDRVTGIRSLLGELNFTIDVMICDHSLRLIENKNENIQYIPIEKDKINILKGIERQIVFADDISLTLVSDSNVKMRVASPFIVGSQRAQHLPIMGEKGSDYLLETIDAYLQKLQ